MLKQTSLAIVGAVAFSSLALSQQTRVRVVAENLAPAQGTYLTPMWVSFHDGTFDVYDDGVAASAALESMAEDGDPAALAADFVAAAVGQTNGVLGLVPFGPGETVAGDFLVDPTMTTGRFASFVSMVVPSNDAFVGNADPLAIPVFDAGAAFVAEGVFVTGADVRDAGTEVNDELPANTAFFGQETPDTGTDEGGVVGPHAGYNAKGTGGVLDDPMFSEGDFTASGYPVVKVRFAAAPAITEAREHTVELTGDQEVPPVSTKVKGKGSFDLQIGGTTMTYGFKFKKKKPKKVTGAHLHLGAAGVNGPIVVSLFSPESPKKKLKKLKGSFTADDLEGPLTAMPLDALVAEIELGNVYLNVHTEKNPAGAVRGQLELVVP